MATIQGTGGAVTAVGFVAKFTGWTAQLVGELFSTTGFGDKGWQTGKIITGQVVGSAVGIIETTVPVPAAALAATFGVGEMEAEVVLTFDTGKTWTFDATITTVDLGRAETGSGSSAYSVSFSSTGAVTQAWA